MKLALVLLLASSAFAGDSQPYVGMRTVEGDPSAVEFWMGSADVVLRSKGDRTAPALSMRNDGQGVYLSVLKGGATLSLYKRVAPTEMREWLRISYAGIRIADETGDLKRAFTGRIRPGCAAIVNEGIITGEDCGQ